VIEGEVELQTERGDLNLKTKQAGTVRPGLRPEPVLMREANDLIQWCLYYPAVLDADELELSASQQAALTDSMAAYRSGDLKAALERFPSNQADDSDAERIYRAALLLAVGQVQEASRLLALSSGDSTRARDRALTSAVAQLIASVKSERRAQPAASEFATASEWLAESYRLQSEAKLDEALRAARKSVEASPKFGFGWARVAELEFSFGRVPAAREALDRALQLAPRNAQPIALRGFLLAAENRIQPAIASFDEAIALDGALAIAWLGAWIVSHPRGQFGEGQAGPRSGRRVGAAAKPVAQLPGQSVQRDRKL